MDIDITASERKTLLFLLNAFLPSTTVWAYGSRVKFTSKPESDLDLVAFINPEEETQLSDLRNAFSESDLPFKIDILGRDTLPENFKQNIQNSYAVLQDSRAKERGMPDTWKSYKLDEIAELRKDSFLPNGKNLPYIGLEHIEQQSLRLNSVGSAENLLSNKFHFLKGDILYGKLRPYFRKVYHPRFEGVCSTDIFVIKNKKPVSKDYLFYLIATEEFTSIANSGSTGTHMPRADWGQLKNSTWAIPSSLVEQESIASILSSLDNKIELNIQMNQTLENIAQSIFKKWFVNFNFPGFTGVLTDGLPAGWKTGKLGEISDFVKGVSYRSAELKNSPDALVTLKSINRNGGFNIDGFKEFDGKYKTAQELHEGDVIIAQTDITQAAELIGCPAIVENTFSYRRLIASIDIIKFTPKPNTVSNFTLYHILKQKPFKDYCLSHTNGSTVLHLKSSELSNFELIIPDKELTDRFEDAVRPVREKILSQNKESFILKNIRDNLLPKLMTGKIQISA